MLCGRKATFKIEYILVETKEEDLQMKIAINIQDQFLNQLRKDGTNVTVFLLNGFQIRGQIKGFDNFTVLIESEGKQQLIYKHAISTFVPNKNITVELE